MAGWIPEICRPISAVSQAWNDYNVSNIDDAVVNPNAGDGSCIGASKLEDNTTQSYNLAQPASKFIGIIDKITVDIRARKVEAPGNPSVSITINGVTLAAQTIVLTTSFAYYTKTFVGHWSLADLLAGFILNFTAGTVTKNDYFEIDVAYATIFGYPIPGMV
jgi:hypothetical protein